jgi:hypothetical protein
MYRSFPSPLAACWRSPELAPFARRLSGMAPVLFSSHFGLLGGFISSLCHLAVSMTMALAAYLPEPSHAPLGRVYLAIGTITGALLGYLGSGRRQVCAPHPLVEAMPSDSACFGDAFRPYCLQRRPDRFWDEVHAKIALLVTNPTALLSCQVESWCQAALHPKTCCKHLFDSL